MRALDVNGQAEAWPSGGAAEFNVSLPGTCQPDAFEPDNTTTQATQIFTNKPVQANLCGPADADWFRWQIDAVHPWFVSVKSLGSGAAIRLAIFDQNGSTLLASSQSPGLNLDTFLVFTPTQTGTVYIKVLPLVDNLCGTDAKYQVLLSKAHQIFLPFTKK